tara:strand:+ start:1139 stop:1402 length:264 start_codon:yes stop_codon:yes gene_type:complete
MPEGLPGELLAGRGSQRAHAVVPLAINDQDVRVTVLDPDHALDHHQLAAHEVDGGIGVARGEGDEPARARRILVGVHLPEHVGARDA